MARTFGYATMGVTIGVANLLAGAIGTSQNGLLAWAYVVSVRRHCVDASPPQPLLAPW